MTATRHPRSGLVTVAVLLAVTGCSGQDAGLPSPTPTSSVARVFADYLAQARTANASASQIAALESAVRTGELPFETVDALTRETYDCFTEHGIGFVERDPIELGVDYYVPDYSYDAQVDGLTEEQTETLADRCMAEFSMFADLARQDSAGVAQDQKLLRSLPEIVACLRENGVEVADNATPDEVRQATDKLFRDSMKASNDTATVWCYPEGF